MIRVKDYITTAFSIDDANKIDAVVKEELGRGEPIVLDFSDITIFTTLFFNNALAKYVTELSPDEFDKKFKLVNLSAVGETTFKHSYDNAVEYFTLPPDKRIENEKILEETLEE